MSDGWLTRGGDDLLDLGGASPIAAASQVGTVSAAAKSFFCSSSSDSGLSMMCFLISSPIR